MVASTFARDSGSTCQQLLLLFYILSTIIITTYANSDAKHPVILIPRQGDGTYEDPQWVEGDGSEDDPSDDTTVYPTTTDYYEDPSTETNYYDDTATATGTNWDDPTATESNWADTTTESYWEDPATTTDYWQDSTTTDYWQGTTTESSWDDTTTESYWEQTTTYSEEATSTEAAVVVPTTTEQTVAAETTTQQNASSTQEQPTPATTTTESFSITSSTATPSLVLGSNECAEDLNAVGGTCPSDYFCNAATKQCEALSDNGGQCYEDFQCKSSYCGENGTCADQPNESGTAANLSGGEIAGVTIGSVAGAVVLVGALMLCQKRRSHQVSTRARKFEQIRTEDAEDDLEAVGVMRDMGNGDHRTSKYNFLASLMTGTALGRSLSQLGNNDANNRSMESQTYLHHGSQSVMSERSLQPQPPPPPSTTTTDMAGAVGAAAAGAGALAVAAHNINRQSKVEPVDPSTLEDQQYYGNLAIGPSSPTHTTANNHANDDAQQGQQQQEQYNPYRPNPHASWMSQTSAIDPFGTAATHNYATQLHQTSAATSSVERPPTTVIRESTYNNLHAPIFHISAPPDDNTVPAGGGAYVPALAPTIHDQPRQSPEMDAFGGNGGEGGKRGSWLLKEIAARWQQGSATGARASGITATTDPSSVNNDSSTSHISDEAKQHQQQRPQHVQKDSGDNSNNNKGGGMLWDDGLASAGGSTVARSASTASTNPFRSSMSNPRDSVISALRIPLIQEDAWSLEDHVAMSSDSSPVTNTTTKANNNNDTSPAQQQHHQQ